MKDSQNYVLVIGAPSTKLPETRKLSQTLSCPVVTITSPVQALALAQADPPHLVILSGDDSQTWSPQIARQIKQSVQPEGIVIVAITASSERSWQAPENNTEIDGFFVEPLSDDVWSTLNESAITKKKCLHAVRLSAHL